MTGNEKDLLNLADAVRDSKEGSSQPSSVPVEEKTVNELFEDLQGLSVKHYRADSTSDEYKKETEEIQYIVSRIKLLVLEEVLKEVHNSVLDANWSKGLVKEFALKKGIIIK